MRIKHLTPLLFLGGMLSLQSCIDNDYDLSDLDTTIGVNVNDLTVSINLEEIKLEKVMDLSDDSQIKELVDPSTGKKVYAVLEEGTFESKKISIEAFSTDAPDIENIQDALPLKYVNNMIQEALDNAINDAVDKEINKKRDELIAELEAEYAAEKQKLVDAAIAEAQAQSPIPLTEEQKKQIEAQVEATVEATLLDKLGYTHDGIIAKATEEVENRREEIKRETRNDPAVRAEAQEIAWKSFEDDYVFAQYDISNKMTAFSTESHNVDKALRSLAHITAESDIRFKLELTNLTEIINVVIKDAKLQLPKGLDLVIDEAPNKEQVKYNPADGILDIGEVEMVNGEYSMKLSIHGIDVAHSDIKFEAQKDGPGSFVFEDELGAISGHVGITKKSFINGNTIFDLPDEASYICTPEMDDIKVLAISGEIQYDIDEPKIDPVNINDLPDVLTDKETSIFLGNPQIYLSLNNPLVEDKVYPQMGLKITAVRDNAADNKSYRLDNGIFSLEKDQNVFCLSPEMPKTPYTGFENAKHEKYSGLASLLSGKGIPKRLDIDVEDPQIRRQYVENFHLGRDLDPLVGKYTFYAPLNLAEGSIIVYRDTIDGWGDDLEKMTIKKLALHASVVSGLPLSAKLTVKPVDKNGKEIKNVECNAVTVNAGADEQDIVFNLDAPDGMTGLDGVILHATVLGDASNNSLSPEQTIVVKSAKITVSGQYIEPDED